MEIGTKIFIKKTTFGCKGAEGCEGIVTNKESSNGLNDLKPGPRDRVRSNI